MVSVGGPQSMLLNAWGVHVWDVFGARPYLVGSSVFSKQFRDVDVRVMLDDAGWDRFLPGVPHEGAHRIHPAWSGLCMAFSAWGQVFTGLPIDFQLQHVDVANEKWPVNREPLGSRIRRGDAS